MDTVLLRMIDTAQIRERDSIAAILDVTSTLLVVLDRQARVIHFNRTCEQLTGFRSVEVEGRPFWELFLLPDERARVQHAFARLLADQHFNTRENHWFTRWGNQHLIAWTNTVLLDKLGKVNYVIGTGVNITAYQQREAHLQAIFENAAIGITLVNLEHHIVACNPAFEQFVGYRAAELRRRRYPIVTHIDDIAEDKRLYNELVTGYRDSYQLEKRYLRKDRQLVWGRLTASLVRDIAGMPQYIVGMVEDITARKQAEHVLRESEAQFRLIIERAALGLQCIAADGPTPNEEGPGSGELSAPATTTRATQRWEPHDRDVPSLTPREREVLALLITGQTNRAIAARLGISVRTVEFHSRNLFAKLGAHSRLEALYIAQQRGKL